MYSIEEFDEAKSRVLKYVLYQRRTEQEVRIKFITTMDTEILEDVIEYLKEADYINDIEYIDKKVDECIRLKNLSLSVLKYKFLTKGLSKHLIDAYFMQNEEKLRKYEINSIKNIIQKKKETNSLDEIKLYLYKKGFNHEYVNKLIKKEQEKEDA